jgi:hypothetical protein
MSAILPRRLFLLALVALAIAGCGQPVREDRSITFSGDGSQSGFQHGNEGVFVVEAEGEAPKKIFQPGDDVVATSPPLWGPTDKRLLFTTARPVHGETDPVHLLAARRGRGRQTVGAL